MNDIQSLMDEEVVELVRYRDQELYTEVVRRYQDKLLRYAKVLVHNHAVAEDAVQEAFIKAFINLHGFNTKKKFSSWIYRIVHNEAVNRIKKEAKTVSIEDNKRVIDSMQSSEDSPETKLEKKETAQLLVRCVGDMPVLYRSVLTLFYLEEKSYEEISDILRIPVGTVGTRITRGKNMMKLLCESKGGKNYV